MVSGRLSAQHDRFMTQLRIPAVYMRGGHQQGSVLPCRRPAVRPRDPRSDTAARHRQPRSLRASRSMAWAARPRARRHPLPCARGGARARRLRWRQLHGRPTRQGNYRNLKTYAGGRARLRDSFRATRTRALVVNYGSVSGSVGDLDPHELSEAGSLFLTRPAWRTTSRTAQRPSAARTRSSPPSKTAARSANRSCSLPDPLPAAPAIAGAPPAIASGGAGL